jgi:IclR family transcriptional regulator, KDG regulon repressor
METPAYATRSVDRAFDVLELLATGPATLSEVSRRLGLSRSTAYKTLASLEARAYLARDPERGLYHLGAKVLYLAQLYYEQHPLIELARPFLEMLVSETQETAHLAIRQGLVAALVDRVESPQGLKFVIPPGETTPLHAGAGAKVLLAYCPEDVLDEVLSNGLPALTDHTISDPQCFRSELERIRRQGYAESEGELTPGVRTVAAAILDHQDYALASIGISGPTARFPDHLVAPYALLVTQAAADISTKIAPGRSF